jgi:hypothetical protein
MFSRSLMGFAVVAALAGAMTDVAVAGEPVAGEKLDTGLGNLPPYAEWHRTPGLAVIAAAGSLGTPAAKQDNGLGALPPYSEWHRHPELARLLLPSQRGNVSLRATPAAGLVAGIRD